MKDVKTDKLSKTSTDLPIAKKDALVNVGKIYQLKKGIEIPKEIDKSFYSSFKSENII